jgi:hypothetical protein
MRDGNVEIGGLILCKAPVEMVEARRVSLHASLQNQMSSVDNHFMRNNDARMPLFAECQSTQVN